MAKVLPRRAFGTTGHESSRVIFGAAALMSGDERLTARAFELLDAYGVNHIDVGAAYGEAEQELGRYLPELRQRFFVATKTVRRDYAGAREDLHRSLERLRCDRIDLWQLHSLTDPSDQEQALGVDGALRALVEAREEGLVRFLGVSGHGTRAPAAHSLSLARFPFDSVLLPYNYPMLEQTDYARDFRALRTLCAERGIAMQTIKAVARRRWAHGMERQRRCWYEPIEEPRALAHAVQFVLAEEELFLNGCSDLEIFERILAAAAQLDPACSAPSDTDMRESLEAVEAQPLFVPGLDDVGPAPP